MILRLTVLLFIALLCGCTGAPADWDRVNADDFEATIASNPDGFLLDVRTESEWRDDGYLDGATLVPHSELQDREDELPEDKDSTVLLYCRSGNRSQQAAETLQDMGFTRIIELESGINGWKDAGKSVVYD